MADSQAADRSGLPDEALNGEVVAFRKEQILLVVTVKEKLSMAPRQV